MTTLAYCLTYMIISRKEPTYETLVLIVLSSNEYSGESAHMQDFAKFAVCIHKVWMEIKTESKIQTSRPTGYVRMEGY